jgi:hypothetical protein
MSNGIKVMDVMGVEAEYTTLVKSTAVETVVGLLLVLPL